ncbi:MAG: triose-phosphate isomerase [Geminicoccaceae bacterium]|nr:triose-phosphate isomerase [Geminicoccaceae bacterium]
MTLARPVVIGNWKMNGLRADGVRLAEALAADADGTGTLGVCPPATLLETVAERLKGGPVLLGGQDCSPEAKGAFTGDVAAPMLADLGCRIVIVGHSERRHGHGEDDALVRAKAGAARSADLVPIVCIGETEADKDAGRTLDVLDRQLRGSLPEGLDGSSLIVAYEPVWAIGTGRSATAEEIAGAHRHIRGRLGELTNDGPGVALLYGGSVKADNAGEIMAIPDVDGVLVGGASLDAAAFLAIYRAGMGAIRPA